MVECFSRKPNCKGYSKSNLSRNVYERSCISFSVIFEKTERIDIGLYFDGLLHASFS